MNESSLARHGFPVLAYLTSEPLLLLFTLRIQHYDARKQVTLMLRTPAAYVHGANNKTAFVAQYNADNLLLGTRTNAATVYLPQVRRDGVARNAKDCEWTTLTLCLDKPCPLWCPFLKALTPAPSEHRPAPTSCLATESRSLPPRCRLPNCTDRPTTTTTADSPSRSRLRPLVTFRTLPRAPSSPANKVALFYFELSSPLRGRTAGTARVGVCSARSDVASERLELCPGCWLARSASS
ncbi:uncharacterized protein EKO05_0003193 [Ascochyta rabiei]|uniref:uncharacterized protein n=1 Tax=Didymella rabiei TaxID=5454 RepID=UPI0021FA666B|nr:uncharacterized protein EKO05_0003193 [Ascochyta rabiei]UPX12652.1 hypothetical protein EKO05_0003193 [Ascochyta rabiei]